jgi:hypothetical protein
MTPTQSFLSKNLMRFDHLRVIHDSNTTVHYLQIIEIIAQFIDNY